MHYLRKKRKKIFIIKKQIKKKKFKIMPISNNDNSKENIKQTLINISKLVLEYIKEKGKTTLIEIISHIMNVLNINDNDESMQKNIHRRVYDSINIMNALGRIKKNNNEIEYLNYDNIDTTDMNEKETNQITNKDKNNEIKINSKKYDDEEYGEKQKILEGLQKSLIEKYLVLKFYQKFRTQNFETPKNDRENTIKYKMKDSEKIKLIEDSNISSINTKTKINNISSFDIIKRIMAPEILSKLNQKDINENNKGAIFCENSKKNNENLEKDNKLIKNIKNKSDEERININGKQKVKFQIKNNNKNNELDDEAFNYLKNVHFFMDELTYNNDNIRNEKNIFGINNVNNKKFASM